MQPTPILTHSATDNGHDNYDDNNSSNSYHPPTCDNSSRLLLLLQLHLTNSEEKLQSICLSIECGGGRQEGRAGRRLEKAAEAKRLTSCHTVLSLTCPDLLLVVTRSSSVDDHISETISIFQVLYFTLMLPAYHHQAEY